MGTSQNQKKSKADVGSATQSQEDSAPAIDAAEEQGLTASTASAADTTPEDSANPATDEPAETSRRLFDELLKRSQEAAYRAQEAWQERLDAAEASRAAERAAVLGERMRTREHASTGERQRASASDMRGASTQEAAATPPLAAIPSWLVRGGISAWLALGILIIISLIFFGISRIVPVFIGVFIALVVTAILYPMVNFLARWMPRYPATFLSLLAMIAGVGGALYYVISSVVNQTQTLTAQFSSGVNTIFDFLENGPLPFHYSQQDVLHAAEVGLARGQEYIESNASSLAGTALSNASNVATVFIVLALAFFTAIFFLASGGQMWRWFINELPAGMRERAHRAAGAGWYTFAAYARGTIIVAATNALLAGIFLQIVGVPMAAPLAVLVFIGAFIPMVGAPTAMIIAMIVALASQGVLSMVIVGIGVAGIGQIEGHILQPLIMGRQVSLHPVVVGVAVAVGTYSSGLLGAVVAVPLVSVVWSVYSELHERDEPIQGELPAYSPENAS